jgi:selenide,water dikinase
MTALNKKASELCRSHEVHACTDITGFGFLGHLHEMMDGRRSCHIRANKVQVIPKALSYADEFLLTAAGQRNRNHAGEFVKFVDVPFAMEEVLFDPQTSGGLLIALSEAEAPCLLSELKGAGIPAEIVGEILEQTAVEILVTMD